MEKRNCKPIINSLLDSDFYKFTMGQVVFFHYPGIKVRFAFKKRTKDIPLGKIIKEGIAIKEEKVEKIYCRI